MSLYPQQRRAKPKRKRFADGSAVVTCADGSQLVLESSLAKAPVLHVGRPFQYDGRHPATRKK